MGPIGKSEGADFDPVAYDYPPPRHWSDLLRSLLSGRAIQSCADIGCGPGAFLSALSNISGGEVVGVDRDIRMISRAVEKRNPSVLAVCADAEKLPFARGWFDLALLRFLLHHCVDPGGVVREVVRTLAPGGALVVESCDPELLARELEYKLFLEYGCADLARWPSKSLVCELLESVRLEGVHAVDASMVRDTISLDSYLNRVRHWADIGGGTSFWRQLSQSERRLYLREIERKLPMICMDGLFEVRTKSFMVIGFKPLHSR